MDCKSTTISLENLKMFCRNVLVHEGMCSEYADCCADVLSETDAFGIYTHGTINLSKYIQKFRAGGMDIHATPEVINEGPAFAVMDAHNALGLISGSLAMKYACEKASNAGVAFICVKNSSHFGASGYYANYAAKLNMAGIALSNTNPNMTIPGAKGKVIGNNPIAYAVPAVSDPTLFLDISMSNVAALKVIKAKNENRSVPLDWIVDDEGLPTSDPSGFPANNSLQPMSSHKGYGLALMVDLLAGALSGGGMSMLGEIDSWCGNMEKPNNVCHAFLAIDVSKFVGLDSFSARVDGMIAHLHSLPKAKNSASILTPGEMEWKNHMQADSRGIILPETVLNELMGLSVQSGIPIHLEPDR